MSNQTRRRGTVKTSGCGWQEDAFDHLAVTEMDHVARNMAANLDNMINHGRLLEAQENLEYVAALIEQVGIRAEEGETHAGHVAGLVEATGIDPSDLAGSFERRGLTVEHGGH